MRRAQLKMMESIFVLVIFFFLLMFGIGFYAKMSSVTGKQKSKEQMEMSAIQVAARLQYLPEIACTRDGSYVKADCFDLLKLNAFSGVSKSNPEYYQKILQNSIITVHQVYPEQASWTLHNVTVNGSRSIWPNFVPVYIYDSVNDRNTLGFVLVEVQG